MPVVPFMPLIAQGVGMLGGAIAGKKATSAAQQRSPEETAALSGETGAANTLANTGSSLLSQGSNTLAGPTGYYGSLLNGNRAAMANATAAPRAMLQEGIRGQQNQLAQSGVRGAAKDVLSGNIARQGASAVSGLTTGVQGGAAQGLTGIGQGLMQTGAPMIGASGNLFQNMLGAGFGNRTYARGQGQQVGSAIGSLAATAGKMPWGGDDTQTSFSQPGTLPPIGNPSIPSFSGWQS